MQLRFCILDVDRGYTVDKLPNNLITPSLCSLKNNNNENSIVYPHDTESILYSLYPDCNVITLELIPNFRKSISKIKCIMKNIDYFINLYDLSDETGQKIVEFLELNACKFTGAGSLFYDPPRDLLKLHCRYSKIETPMFCVIDDPILNENDIKNILDTTGGYPVFVKPSHTFDSVGIDNNSLIRDNTSLILQVKKVVDDWGGACVEKYIDGREFSVLIVGDKEQSYVYEPVEYNFETSNRFITYEDKWISYKSHWISIPESEATLSNALKKIAVDLLTAYNGDGFCRIDIRQDKKTGALHVLDVNPNCSVFYKDSCTADFIVNACGLSKGHLMGKLLEHAERRSLQWAKKKTIEIKYTSSGFSIHATRNFEIGQVVYTDEESTVRIVTKSHVMKNWTEELQSTFDSYAWPLGPDTYAIWDLDPKKWKPINHSCDPNVCMTGFDVVARRKIGKDEELTIDYSTFEPYHPAFKCWCGTKACRGNVLPDLYKESWFQETYKGQMSPYMEYLVTEHKKQILESCEVKNCH